MRLIAVIAVSLLPFAALAAGGGDGGGDGGSGKPEQTNTTKKCSKGQVWDFNTGTCTDAKSGMLNDDDRYRAVREFAYYGQPDAALQVLATMQEGETDRVMTYMGFANRKAGRLEEGLAWYDKALAKNPDNILARSYYGQALVEMNEMQLAQAQLDEIRARGGAGTWAEISLATAVKTGETFAY